MKLELLWKPQIWFLRDGLQKGPRGLTTSFDPQATRVYRVVLSVCSLFVQNPHLGTDPVADYSGDSGGGEQALLSNPDVRHPVGRSDANNDLQHRQIANREK
jgi:hypothetical protein